MERSKAVGAAPNIIYTSELNESVEQLEINTEYLADYLLGRGLNRLQVDELTIKFSAVDTMTSTDPPRGVLGRYYSDGLKCCVFLATIIKGHTIGGEILGRSAQQVDDNIHQATVRTLAHEIEHYVSDVEQNYQISQRPHFQLPPSYSRQDFERYSKDEEELRACAAEELFDPTQLRVHKKA